MTEKIISCPACNSDNLDNSVYCCQCGSPMREGIPVKYRKSQWLSIILISLFLSFLMTLVLQLFNSCQPEHLVRKSQEQAAPADPAALRQAAQPDPKSVNMGKYSSPSDQQPAEGEESPETMPLVVGRVAIITPEGNRIAEIPAAIISGAWLALPSRACIGGNKWQFTSRPGDSTPIAGGLWDMGDAVGFWRLAGKKKISGPSFDTWRQDKPVRLLLFQSGKLSEEINLTKVGQEGIFAYCSLPGPMGPGVFIQDGKVVGWTFGSMLEGAYMWSLPSDTDLMFENYVEDFYNVTFAGGREDYFSRVLAVGSETPPPVQLQMFTEGFWFPPKLTLEDTPEHLRPETVYPYIVELVDYIMDQELYNDITQLADEPLLRELRNAKLLMNVAQAIQKIYSTEAAVNFIEGPGAEIRQAIEGETPHLDRLHVDLYLGWINNLLESGDTIKGRQIFNRASARFRDSLELHLLGVELALADRDWAEAESLLYQKKYPLAFREKMMSLANRISTLKGKENQIVISFQPGSNEIPVTAAVNATIDHDFLIDTGSSFVTIPYSTVEFLGLENELSDRQQEVQTAGGPVYASVVTLASIVLQGWVVKDVQALVIDLPGRPGMGLLGLNFLDKFRMDLQSDNGVLTLEPQ